MFTPGLRGACEEGGSSPAAGLLQQRSRAATPTLANARRLQQRENMTWCKVSLRNHKVSAAQTSADGGKLKRFQLKDVYCCCGILKFQLLFAKSFCCLAVIKRKAEFGVLRDCGQFPSAFWEGGDVTTHQLVCQIIILKRP